jgi:signal transduction histidine kinase
MKKGYLQRLQVFTHLLLTNNHVEDINQIIVEEAMNITGAEYGSLVYKEKDEIKKGYASSPFLLKIIKRGTLEKAMQRKNIFNLQRNDLRSEDDVPELKNHDIKTIAVLPLSSQNTSLGMILLFSPRKDFLDEITPDLLNLFCSIATLGLKKTLGQRELKKGLELRDRFISIASHELRTPLTSINGYIQLLRRKIADQNISEARWIESLYVESLRLTTLMKELLDINRINQGKFAFVFSEVSMKDVVEKSIERARVTATQHKIIFENKIINHQHTVIGDFDKLVEMVSGILTNAIKFSPAHSEIHVTLNSNPRTIFVTVKDVGKGMSQEDLAAIFEGFYKSDVAHIEGMGVGLFLAKHIVAHHRGKIKVNSKVDKGTTVEVTLPQAKN